MITIAFARQWARKQTQNEVFSAFSSVFVQAVLH